MKRLLVPFGMASVLVLVAGPSWGQRVGAPTQPSQPTSPAPSSSASPNVSSQPSNRQIQPPLYVSGRVLMETGQPVPEPVSVGLSCGMREVQVVHTDLKGYFQFTLGAGPQSNIDTSASNDTSLGGFGLPGSGNSPFNANNNMMGCELRVSVSGYTPLSKLLTSPPDIEGIDAGTLLLRRRAG